MLKESVQKARFMQTQRFGPDQATTNAAMTHRQVEDHCALDDQCRQLLKQAMSEFGLSARAHDKICKIARTIADLEDFASIQPEHVAEAISYRRLDRRNVTQHH